jgi:hypothetical protein
VELLTRRLETMERRLSRYRQLAVGLSAVLTVGFVVAADSGGGKVVEADRFVLRGTNGKPEAALEHGPVGPRLVMMDATGDIRAVVAHNQKSDTPSFLLRDKKGTKQLIMAVADEEDAIVFQDRGVNRLVVDTDSNGDPVIVLKDREGNPRTILSGYSADAGLHVKDGNQKTRAQFYVTKEGPKIELRDDDGSSVFTQPAK